MYSPNLSERLIPPLYRLARLRREPMTRVVAAALEAYLATQGTASDDTRRPCWPAARRPRRVA
jgi:hypothetical protein